MTTTDGLKARSWPRLRVLATVLILIVLAAGGAIAPVQGASTVGTWSYTGTLTAERLDHLAIPLSGPNCNGQSGEPGYCGKVLVAGGIDGDGRVLATAEIYDPPSEQWSVARPMHVARRAATAVALGDGRVLVIGGVTAAGNSGLKSAEIYDPLSDTWAKTGSMAATRSGYPSSDPSQAPWRFGAALLNDGRVLAAGGAGATAEIFTPSASGLDEGGNAVVGRWGPTAPMRLPHVDNSVTLLADGKVLVAGGRGGLGGNTSEVFDPSAEGTWTATAPMSEPRSGHTASLLPSGKVLVVGGLNRPDFPTAELYDPTTTAWTPTGRPALGRQRGATATVLPSGDVVLVGASDVNATPAAEIYDSTGGTWAATGTPREKRLWHTATLLRNGKILVAGGRSLASTGTTVLASTELLDPAPDATDRPSITSITPSSGLTGTSLKITGIGLEGMTSVRFGDVEAEYFEAVGPSEIRVTAPPVGGPGTVSVVVEAGGRKSAATKPARFTYITGRWFPAPDMGVPRVDHASATIRDGTSVLVTGGLSPSGGAIASAEIYSQREASWTPIGTEGAAAETVAPMPSPRRKHTSTALHNGKVLVIGGHGASGAPLQSALLYDPAQNVWDDTVANPAFARAGHTATVLASGDVLVAGGLTGSGFAAVAEVFRVQTLTWQTAGEMQIPRYQHSTTLLKTGEVLVAGGCCGTDSHPLAASELFRPQDLTWRQTTGPMQQRRTEHAAEAMPDGSVLVSGGYRGEGKHGLAAAEIYDVGSGSWTATMPMSIGRERHTLTRMPDGSILAVGDNPFRIGTSASDAETFDPTTRTWAPHGTPDARHSSHTSSVLSDGTVLVAGGRAYVSDAATARVSRYEFRPAARPPVISGLDLAAGTTLGNTRIRISGSDMGPLPKVEFGNNRASVVSASNTHIDVLSPPGDQGVVPVRVTTPAGVAETPFTYGRGTWVLSDPLSNCSGTQQSVCKPRFGHTSTVLADGSVLVVGGQVPTGTGSTTAPTTTAQIFDPGTRTWRATNPLREARSFHTATLLHGPLCESGPPLLRPSYCGKVLVAGDAVIAELFDPVKEEWVPVGPLPEARYMQTATLLDGGACRSGSPLPDHCGKVLVAGGFSKNNNGSQHSGALAHLYDPIMATWSSAPPMTACSPMSTSCSHRGAHTATLLADGRVLVAGGIGPVSSEDVRCAPNGAVGYEILIRFCFRSTLDSAQVYDPSTGTWSPTGSLGVGRYLHSATLLDGPECAPTARPAYCGKVLVVGGASGGSAIASAELFDPSAAGRAKGADATDLAVKGAWVPAGIPKTGRAGHSVAVLRDGAVMVAGGDNTPGTDEVSKSIMASGSSVELYEPSSNSWSRTSSMGVHGLGHTATTLVGAPCASAKPPTWCGTVLVTGGSDDPGAIDTTEVYFPAATITKMAPRRGPYTGGTPITVTGTDFMGAVALTFGSQSVGCPSAACEVLSPSELKVVAPEFASRGPVQVGVVNAGGTSATLAPNPTAIFTYIGDPGLVSLVATGLSENAVRLDFAAADDGTTLAPATSYVIKQSTSEIKSDSQFNAAKALCGGVCDEEFDPAPSAVGQDMSLTVGGLTPGSTYYYAVKAVGVDGALGPLSNVASATTSGTKPSVDSGIGIDSGDTDATFNSTACPAVGSGEGQIAYRAGYSLVGLPSGTAVPTKAPMYSWFDLGAGGNYSARAGSDGVEAGHGYWAWFPCPVAVDVPATSELPSFGLGAYRASMVGNPTGTGTAAVSGHDFAATWDQSLNDGAGGYHLSGYREAQLLAVGQGAWVFSYATTTIAFAVA